MRQSENEEIASIKWIEKNCLNKLFPDALAANFNKIDAVLFKIAAKIIKTIVFMGWCNLRDIRFLFDVLTLKIL